MKKWFMIDTLPNGEKHVSVIDETNDIMVRFRFQTAWQNIPKEQQERRKALIAYYCEQDADGGPDLSRIQTTLKMG